MEFKARKISNCGTANLILFPSLKPVVKNISCISLSLSLLFLLKELEQRLKEVLHLILNDDQVGK